MCPGLEGLPFCSCCLQPFEALFQPVHFSEMELLRPPCSRHTCQQNIVVQVGLNGLCRLALTSGDPPASASGALGLLGFQACPLPCGWLLLPPCPDLSACHISCNPLKILDAGDRDLSGGIALLCPFTWTLVIYPVIDSASLGLSYLKHEICSTGDQPEKNSSCHQT